MRILLDENTTADLKELLSPHEVRHVRECGWTGMQNGLLLREAIQFGFDVLITVDKQMRHQQNLHGRAFSLIVLDIHPTSAGNQIACLEQLLELIPSIKLGHVYVISR